MISMVRTSLCAAIVLAALVGGARPAEAQYRRVGVFQLTNRQTGKSPTGEGFFFPGRDLYNFAYMVPYAGSTSQKWVFYALENGNYVIGDYTSGGFLTANSGTDGLVSVLPLIPYHMGTTWDIFQQWQLRPMADGSFLILNAWNFRPMSDPNIGTPTGGKVLYVEPYTNLARQRWTLQLLHD